MDMRFSVERHDGVSVVRLGGDVRVDQVPDFYEPLCRQVSHEKLVIVDLAEVVYIDSAGIAALVGLHRRMRGGVQGRLILCGARPGVWGVFQTMKLDRLFPLHPDLSHAMAAEGLVDRELTHG